MDASHPFLKLDFLSIPSLSTHLGLAENRDWHNSCFAIIKEQQNTDSAELFSWWARRSIIALPIQLVYIFHTLTALVMRSSKWSSVVLVEIVSWPCWRKGKCISEGSNRAVSMWYLGMGIGGREMGWEKNREKEKQVSEGIKDHPNGWDCREAIHWL